MTKSGWPSAPEMRWMPVLSAFTWPKRSTSTELLMEIKLSSRGMMRTPLV